MSKEREKHESPETLLTYYFQIYARGMKYINYAEKNIGLCILFFPLKRGLGRLSKRVKTGKIA